MSNENKKAGLVRFKEAKNLPHRELARKFVSATTQLEQWVELAMAMASYYINIEPHAEIFNGSTFNENTLDQIRERAPLTLKDVPYSRIVYIVDQDDLTKKLAVPVDVVTITDDEQWEQMIVGLNQERDRQSDIERSDPPADCLGCNFRTSCSNSTLKTGLRVYGCAQFAPIPTSTPFEKVPGGDNANKG